MVNNVNSVLSHLYLILLGTEEVGIAFVLNNKMTVPVKVKNIYEEKSSYTGEITLRPLSSNRGAIYKGSWSASYLNKHLVGINCQSLSELPTFIPNSVPLLDDEALYLVGRVSKEQGKSAVNSFQLKCIKASTDDGSILVEYMTEDCFEKSLLGSLVVSVNGELIGILYDTTDDMKRGYVTLLSETKQDNDSEIPTIPTILTEIQSAKKLLREENCEELCKILASSGRVWIEIEDHESRSVAEDLLEKVLGAFGNVVFDDQAEACCKETYLWAYYLRQINNMFSGRKSDQNANPFDEEHISLAEEFDLGFLFNAERLEFFRRKNESGFALSCAIRILNSLQHAGFNSSISDNKIASQTPNNRYSVGTAYFILAKLSRSGGQLKDALAYFQLSRKWYDGEIEAHRNEIEHCDYAITICDALKNRLKEPTNNMKSGNIFLKALNNFSTSLYYWNFGDLEKAVEYSKSATQKFRDGNYPSFENKANVLTKLYKIYNMKKASPNEIIPLGLCPCNEIKILINSETTDEALLALAEWFTKQSPATLLGLFQLCYLLTDEESNNIYDFHYDLNFMLPRLIDKEGVDFQWLRLRPAKTIREAHQLLKNHFGIRGDHPTPMLVESIVYS